MTTPKIGIIEEIAKASTIIELDSVMVKLSGYTMASKATVRRAKRKANARAVELS